MSVMDLLQVTNMGSSDIMNSKFMDRSLKGLLMDKGARGLERKIRNLLQEIELIQASMESLVEQQRLSREQSGCDCLDLYLALNLKPGLSETELQDIKTYGARAVHFTQTRQPLTVEWRARRGFASEYGYAQSRRIHPFRLGSDYYTQVREYVTQRALGYYETLAGYDAVRITLNAALKSIRRDAVELTLLAQEVAYPQDIEREAEKAAKKFFKRLPESEQIAKALNQRYGYDN
jgi:hypothetical protein